MLFGKIILQRPNLIIMDEPTNHLDMESIEALIEALNKYNGGIVLISHDIRLIENIDCNIWICEDKNINVIEERKEEKKETIITKINKYVSREIKDIKSTSIFDFI